ncbi:glycosyltransferase family 4 protein [Segetibacter sp.]|uniref:glycosyltransferase family 4 protein n=1 Tax=Segetibacter sp. TaxID=2231182 RepID=UPI00262A2CF9|nr:glycosyltransferase family 4 protein [Segetibacter sp.]MCW3079596.1 glycosyltransferase [Segetibacter sp.]
MKSKKRLAIVTTHPIQYNAPLFKLLNEESCFTIKVFYTWSQSKQKVFDKDFGLSVAWDIPLLDGYDYKFVDNVSATPGSHHFKGVINPTLNSAIEDWKADAMLVYGWAFSSHLKAIRHFHKKIPVLFRGDSTLLDESSRYSVKKLVRRLFLRWVYSHVDFALYVGSANKKYFESVGFNSKQLLFAPHAIDNSRFTTNEYGFCQDAKKWRLRLGIPEKDLIFLFAAKLIKKKDPELLINSFLRLKASSTWLILVGNGELEKELKEKYKSFSNVKFIDFQNQSRMPVVYRLGDVFVLPSRGPGETWGLALNEAMACGRAVIASDKCGGSVDLIENGKNGYVFKNSNTESLKSRMNEILYNYKEFGICSGETIKEWNYSKTVDQIKSVFKHTIAG